jgi:hypothetical protein
MWMPGHTGIDGNHMAGQLARHCFLHPLTEPETAIGIFGKTAWEVIRGWTNTGSPSVEKHRLKTLKTPCAKITGQLLILGRNQLQTMKWLLIGYSCLKGHLYKLGLLNCPEYDSCKQALEIM